MKLLTRIRIGREQLADQAPINLSGTLMSVAFSSLHRVSYGDA